MVNLQHQLQDQIAKTRLAKPEFMRDIDYLMVAAQESLEASGAIAVGEKAPDFELPDAQGKMVALSGLLEKGSLVVTFYRGSWCPYCNLQIRALQDRLAEIRSLGADLIAISPQAPDISWTQTERDSLEFTVLSDKNLRTAAKYGVAWEVPALILDHMRNDRNLDLADINQGNGNKLPMPATFVINRDGVVVWRFVEVDYRTRAEPDDIISALGKIATTV